MAKSWTLIFLLLFFTLAVSKPEFYCFQQWRSDGNYYEMNFCMQSCVNANHFQNVTDVYQLSNKCCTSICNDQIGYHIMKRTVIIVVSLIILFLVLICCIFGCCGPNIKNSYVMHEQGKLRKTVSTGISSDSFDALASKFSGIFTEQYKNQWQLTFSIDNKRYSTQWFLFRMKKLQNFKYELFIQGQDLFGLWKICGFYVNTNKGPMVWGLKNYENIENNTIFFQKQSNIIYELVWVADGSYEGHWYNRLNKNNQGACTIKRKIYKLVSRQTQQNFNAVSYEENI